MVVEYTVEADANGDYSTPVNQIMAPTKVTDVYGEEIPANDYETVYFHKNGKIVADTESVDQTVGGAPNAAGEYTVVIVEKDAYDAFIKAAADKGNVMDNDWTWDNNWEALPHHSQAFSITKETIDVADAFIYEVNANDDKDFTDTEGKYTGNEITIGFSVAGEQMTAGYNIAWVEGGNKVTQDSAGVYTLTEAGTYTAKITGAGDAVKGGYVGSKEVSFVVKPIDLANDTITIAPKTSLTLHNNDKAGAQVASEMIYVNGEQLAGGLVTKDVFTSQLIAIDGVPASNAPEAPITTPGTYTFAIADNAADANVIGGTKTVDAEVVNGMVDYLYKGKKLDEKTPVEVDLVYGESFDPAYLSASYGGKDAKFSYEIYNSKNAKVDAIEGAGEYKLVMTTDVFEGADGNTYAGYGVYTIEVTGKSYAGSTAFVSVDGKIVSAGKPAFEYTGEAFEPVVVAKDAKGNALVEGTDYAVEVTEGDAAAESILEPGTYTVTVKFADGVTEVATDVVVDKATIASAEAVVDTAYEAYPLPADGSAVAPAFKGYTKEDLKGNSFDLAASDIAVTYYAGEQDENGNWSRTDKEVAAADLTEAGEYYADITVLTTADYIKSNGIVTVEFTIADAVSFVDVDANEWYAEYIYEANQQRYMNGYNGTKLFVPEAAITRAEIAQVVYNMAGAQGGANLPNPDFDDVVETEWYKAAIAFVNAAGVMTGYEDTNIFGVNDNATREQIATTMYRYAKVAGIDTTVEDADAALAKYSDGDQVSGFAKTAMAWAVENGIMGVDVTALDPQGDVTRAQVAATSVRVQPDKLENPVIPAV